MEDCIYRNHCPGVECPCGWYKTELDELYEGEINRHSYDHERADIMGEPLSIVSEPQFDEELNFDPRKSKK